MDSGQPAWLPADIAGWVIAALTLGWLVLAALTWRLARAVASRKAVAFLSVYAGIGGACGSFNLVLFSWFFIRPGINWQNVAEIVPLVLYFLLTAATWPLWLLWWLDGTLATGSSG